MTTNLFFKIPQAIAARRDLTATDKLVYAVIAFRIGQNDSCWPGTRRLAQDVGTSRWVILKAVRRLEQVGFLRVQRHIDGKSNSYQLVQSGDVNTPLPNEIIGVENTHSGVEKTQGGAENAQGGVENAQGGVEKTQEAVSKRHHKRKGKDKRKDKRKEQEGESDLNSLHQPCGEEFPVGLDTPGFAQAWEQWQTHRRELRRPLTATTTRRQLAMLARYSADTAEAMIWQSIEHGWMGLFALKERGASDAQRQATAAEKLARGQPVNVWRADGSWDHEAEAALLDSTIRIFTPEELQQIVKGTF